MTLSVELDDQRPEFAAEIADGFDRFLAMIKRLLDEAKSFRPSSAASGYGCSQPDAVCRDAGSISLVRN